MLPHETAGRSAAPGTHGKQPGGQDACDTNCGQAVKSDHPESNQGPSDVCKFYSQMLYQLSYSRDASLRGAHNCISAASIMCQVSMSACGDGNTGEAASLALVQSTARNGAAHAML